MRAQTSFERFSSVTCRKWFAISITFLRLAIGLELLMAGLSKLGGWSATSYLENATGPLASWFQSMAGNPLIDFLNIWGLILIGAGLIVGLLVRPVSFFGFIFPV